MQFYFLQLDLTHMECMVGKMILLCWSEIFIKFLVKDFFASLPPTHMSTEWENCVSVQIWTFHWIPRKPLFVTWLQLPWWVGKHDIWCRYRDFIQFLYKSFAKPPPYGGFENPLEGIMGFTKHPPYLWEIDWKVHSCVWTPQVVLQSYLCIWLCKTLKAPKDFAKSSLYGGFAKHQGTLYYTHDICGKTDQTMCISPYTEEASYAHTPYL